MFGEFSFILFVVGVVLIILFIGILIHPERPEKCTCREYNFFVMGPVERCEVHKHHSDYHTVDPND